MKKKLQTICFLKRIIPRWATKIRWSANARHALQMSMAPRILLLLVSLFNPIYRYQGALVVGAGEMSRKDVNIDPSLKMRSSINNNIIINRLQNCLMLMSARHLQLLQQMDTSLGSSQGMDANDRGVAVLVAVKKL